MPTPEASHATLNTLEKLGRARICALVSFLLMYSKAAGAFVFHS